MGFYGHTRQRRLTGLVLGSLAIVFFVAACGGSSGTGNTATPTPTLAPTSAPTVAPTQAPTVAHNPNGGAAVTIVSFQFMPASITVKKGATVTWTNQATIAHTATSLPGAPVAFDTSDISGGGSASVTFNTPGTYNYECSIHNSMRGTVIVTP